MWLILIVFHLSEFFFFLFEIQSKHSLDLLFWSVSFQILMPYCYVSDMDNNLEILF